MAINQENRRRGALLYHSEGRPGKIEVVPTKPYRTQSDLSLAYSPGVAEPCLEIEKNPEDAYKYTAKSNLVAVISNGTAVLGLGNIGALAGKPVMEGKGLLFKTFADIDVFDIEVDTTDTEQFIQTVKNIAPTFGGINLEDIKAPECFEIEDRLKKELDIPVMHDDQHGTAIISAAALINALEVVGKKIEEVKVVVNGAGAAAVSCAKLYLTLGVKRENMVMCDSKGTINTRRTDLNVAKKEFATSRDLDTLADAMKGSDVFLGLSVANVLTKEMVQSMAEDPVVLALANPDPEISYDDAIASRPDIIFATGRSDYPNQVNNVLGFPYIFRGALDVRATKINEEMKIAATRALAQLARQPVPEIVSSAYSNANISFGREYLIPKPLDPRLIIHISMAVAKAAIDSGVARKTIDDWEAYRIDLEKRMGRNDKMMNRIRTMVTTAPKKRVAFSDGENQSVIKAAAMLGSEGTVQPILIGDYNHICDISGELNIDPSIFEIIDFNGEAENARREKYASMFYEKMSRKGVSMVDATRRASQRQWFTLMTMMAGDTDATIIDYSRSYTKSLDPIRQLFEAQEKTLGAMNIVSTKTGPMFFADTAINANPTAKELAEIAVLASKAVRHFGYEPVIAMLSNSNFGTDTGEEARKVAKAVEILHREHPELMVDGEMKADIALDPQLREQYYPFNKLSGSKVNTFIFPNLSAANISYKIMEHRGGAEIIGPVLLGLWENIHLQSENADMRARMNLALIAASSSDME